MMSVAQKPAHKIDDTMTYIYQSVDLYNLKDVRTYFLLYQKIHHANKKEWRIPYEETF